LDVGLSLGSLAPSINFLTVKSVSIVASLMNNIIIIANEKLATPLQPH